MGAQPALRRGESSPQRQLHQALAHADSDGKCSHGLAHHLQEPLLLTLVCPTATAEHLPVSITGCCGFIDALSRVSLSDQRAQVIDVCADDLLEAASSERELTRIKAHVAWLAPHHACMLDQPQKAAKPSKLRLLEATSDRLSLGQVCNCPAAPIWL